ncbi:hypothetical protein [Colwellia piezophila]|uniref:hypothetical protein n=1 Tax=Colwellia piezophila TaxID=211668 RepID=UPI000369C355|nr:hypothetical protein [Colwellia piezophila]
MIRYFKLVLFLLVLVSVETYAKSLDFSQLNAFSDLMLKERKDSPDNIFKYLSNKIKIEQNFGSSAQGVTLYFNKTEYINLINRSIEEIRESQQKENIIVFDFKLLPANQGEFTVRIYSLTKRRSIWSTFTIELVENKIKIIKIIEFS